MRESLDDTKKRISRKYLGKAGIHGVGLRRSEKAVYIYLDPDPSPEQQSIISEIEKEAAPFKVMTVNEDKPVVS